MPELSDHVEARLSAFASDTPVTLPGAAAARRRGTQRTRRTRTALGAAGAAVVGVAATGLGLGFQGQDRLTVPAASPPPTQTATAEPPLTGALLDPDDLAGVLGGTWTVRADGGPAGTSSLLLQPCAAAAEPAGVQSAGRSFAGSSPVTQVLVLHADQSTAVTAHAQLLDALERCAETEGAVRLVGGLPGTSATRAYGEHTGPDGTTAFALEQRGRVLIAVTAPVLAELPSLADVAALEVDSAPVGP